MAHLEVGDLWGSSDLVVLVLSCSVAFPVSAATVVLLSVGVFLINVTVAPWSVPSSLATWTPTAPSTGPVAPPKKARGTFPLDITHCHPTTSSWTFYSASLFEIRSLCKPSWGFQFPGDPKGGNQGGFKEICSPFKTKEASYKANLQWTYIHLDLMFIVLSVTQLSSNHGMTTRCWQNT